MRQGVWGVYIGGGGRWPPALGETLGATRPLGHRRPLGETLGRPAYGPWPAHKWS
jgi:hypothetical protein